MFYLTCLTFLDLSRERSDMTLFCFISIRNRKNCQFVYFELRE